MNTIWFKLLILLFAGQVFKSIFPNVIFLVVVDLAVFAAGYYFLRQSRIMDFKKNVIFYGGLVFINLLLDLRIIPDLLANIAVLALMAWWFFGDDWSFPFKRKKSPSSNKLRHKWHK